MCCRAQLYYLYSTIAVIFETNVNCGSRSQGGHSITKHTGGGGWLEGLSQKPQNVSPRIAILKNAKIIPPKCS